MARLAIAVIRLYQFLISPLLPRTCRYHPSCSEYAAGALGLHGPWRGGWMALRRLARCHPWAPGGYDPVEPIGRAEEHSC